MALRRLGAPNLLGKILGHDGEDLDEVRNNLLVRVVVLGGLALILSFWQVPKILQASRSAAWPSINATVSAATNYRQGRRVDLRYVVAGQVYTLEGEFGERDWNVGRQVTIYYDPASPEIARRAAGWTEGDSTRVAVLVVLWGAAGGLLGVLAFRLRQASRGVLELDD